MSTREIYDALAANRRYTGRVHLRRNLNIAGQPGHIYILRRRNRPDNRALANITLRSANAEVTLSRINDTFLISIGNPQVATVTLFVPPQQEGIEDFEWIAHTHPLAQENVYQRVIRGPSEADRRALRLVHQRWGQTSSVVVVVDRNGNVASDTRFDLSADQPPNRRNRRGGGIWTPGP